MTPADFVPVNYLPIVIFIAIALVFGGVTLLLGKILRPSRMYTAKLTTYESGSIPFSDARIPFPLRYYLIAMIFVIFDIEAVFLYPWAVVYGDLKLVGLVAMVLFIGVLLVGYFYAWKKGALEWD
ncbi:MAG: NADH-quinone oxidoreductase subunit A [Nitrospirota bacterium]